MSEHDGDGAGVLSSVEELLNLLGVGGGRAARSPQPSSPTRAIPEAAQGGAHFASGRALSTEVLRCMDGVERLHIYGCGRRPVRLSRGCCQAMIGGWEQLATFAVSAGRPGTRLADRIAIREVNDMLVVEIGGDIGRAVRLTSGKLKKLLEARDAIRVFAGLEHSSR